MEYIILVLIFALILKGFFCGWGSQVAPFDTAKHLAWLQSKERDETPAKPEEIQITVKQIRPWIRYWARMLDLYLYQIILYVPVALFLGSSQPEWMIQFYSLVFWVPLEALIFSQYGNTLGKACLSISIKNSDGSSLSFIQALKRSLNVWVYGCFFNIPFLTDIAAFISYLSLTTHGKTNWDKNGNFVVTHGKVGWEWTIYYILLLFVLSFIFKVIVIGFILPYSQTLYTF